jgi:hypothetical protein
MRFAYDKRLPTLLAEIEETLVSKTPKAVAKLKVSEPAYAIFLWYDDSSSCGDLAPYFGVGVESIRLVCAKRYDSRELVNDCIWRPQQVITELVPRGKFKDRIFINRCNRAYALMLAANKTGEPLEDEGELLHPFRSMMHRVAFRLNEYEWGGLLRTLEEFVVVFLDQTGYWLEEDLKRSIPKAKLKLLQQRGLFFGSK